MANKGNLFIFSAPSGAGKTSLIKALFKEIEGLQFSVSYTTRSKRPGEKDGVDYHFVSEDKFFEMEKQGLFLESAKVFNNYYATSEEWIKNALNDGKDIILEIDWQGAEQIHKKFSNCCKIFILPPSKEELNKRLLSRNEDDKSVIEHRMSKAIAQIQHYTSYDYLVVNDNFEETVVGLASIIRSRRLSYENQSQKLEDLISDLLEK